MLVNQKIKDLSKQNDFEQSKLISDTYEKLEKEKMNSIIKLQNLLEKEESQIINDKIDELDNAIDCFNKIINSKEPNRAVLENIIDTIWIYHDKTVKFDLKPDIKLLIS